MRIPNILILAQTPPPFHGQSIMQNYLVNSSMPHFLKTHIRLELSEEIKDVGNKSLIKILKLISLILRLIIIRINKVFDIVYYPPAGPNKIPFYRDVLLLPFVKVLGKKKVFHFHAGGFNKLLEKLNPIEKIIAKRIYAHCDLAVVLLPSLVSEVEWIKPLRIISIPNGIQDTYSYNRASIIENKSDEIRILFVGNLKIEKGIITLIESFGLIKNEATLDILGGWHNKSIREECLTIIHRNGLQDKIKFYGTETGKKKWQLFENADIFCLPTFENEAMPVTLLEAMMYELAIISTNWRGIPDIVTNGEEGFLVPIKSPESIAEKIKVLLNNPALRKQMGKKGREKFLREFTLDIHLAKMEQAFKETLR